ncbi:MAG TPA: alpha/beta hydrolase [Candidatus Glassbacteria bacterium]|nr:alpha/beta hydrolase [Candidatus Glassbacteria bacterium]
MLLFKSVILAVLSVAAVVFALGVLIRLMENRLTFHPMRELEAFPADYGLAAEDVSIVSGPAGDKLHGWYFSASDGNQPVLLICHGNAGNISHRLDWLAPLVRRGWGALLFDYRGYGRSTGSPSEEGLYQDTEAAYEFLLKQKAVAAERLIVFGRSIGGAPAVRLGVERPCRKLVLEGVFTSGKDMSRSIFGALPGYYFTKYRWDVIGLIGAVRVPVLVIHGTRDRVVPFELGRRLAEAGNKKLVSFWAVDGADHLEGSALAGGRYYDRIADFVERQ